MTLNNQIILNGSLVNYHRLSEGSGQALIFLHGWRSEGIIWKNVAEKLCKTADYNIYALDLPGFGSSPAPKVAFDVSDYTQIVDGFIGKLKLESVVLIGHSFGGRIAIKLAAKKPPYLKKLVLVDSAGIALPSNKKNFMQLGAKLVKPLFKLRSLQDIKRMIYKKIGAEDYLATPYLNETFKKVIVEDLQNCLKDIDVPTLLLWGDKDTDTPLNFMEIFNRKISNSTTKVLKGAGHFSFIDQSDAFCLELSKFLKL